LPAWGLRSVVPSRAPWQALLESRGREPYHARGKMVAGAVGARARWTVDFRERALDPRGDSRSVLRRSRLAVTPPGVATTRRLAPRRHVERGPRQVPGQKAKYRVGDWRRMCRPARDQTVRSRVRTVIRSLSATRRTSPGCSVTSGARLRATPSSHRESSCRMRSGCRVERDWGRSGSRPEAGQQCLHGMDHPIDDRRLG
jgi:hypothetical protein